MNSPISEQKQKLESVRDEWNKAEKAIKLAEQINQKIVDPAIYELRYAGRRLVEALANQDDPEAVKKLLDDAHFDCCRARHDAIDAATAKIANDLDLAVKKLGQDVVLDKFPSISKLLGDLSIVRGLVAKSRENRNDRDKIYQTIQEDRLPSIVELFRQFQACESLMVSAASKNKIRYFLNNLFGVAGLISLAFTIYSIFV